MTTITAPSSRALLPSGPPAVGRLTRIELRKSVDTRASRWLLIGIALIGLSTAVVSALVGDAGDHDFHTISSTIQGAMSVLLPVVSILLVTSEWSQRTTLQTFVLIPRRGRVVAAKLLAGAVIAVAVAGYGIVLSALATSSATPHPADGTWKHTGMVAVGSVLVQLISQLSGMGFGLLLQSSPAAIVANFVIPIGWGALAAGVHALHGVQPWLDPAKVSTTLFSGELGAQQWAQVGVVTSIWVVALLAAGAWRLRRQDIT
jgi:ABC-2 type transport system permease protein